MSEPTTEAGKRLLKELDGMSDEWSTSREMTERMHRADAAAIVDIEGEMRAILMADIRQQIEDRLGSDIRQLATDAERALHCAWPTMMLKALDILEEADR